MQNRDDDSEPTAAERAFDALRAEVAGMRQAMQTLPDLIKKSRSTVDYTETLGAIAKKLEIVGNFMAAIEQHPAIRATPAQHQQAIVAAGEGLINKSVRELDSAKVAAVEERRELAAMIGTMRGQRKQMEWLAITGAVALMVGLLLSPVAARLLPFGGDAAVAASILHTDRWNAGIALMRSTNPEGWATLASEINLVEPNHAALTSCREAAARLKKSQSCAIVVPAP
jgi:hypothetical protein